MGEYERLQAQKKKIIAAEKAKDARSVIARLIPYIQHDYLCACRDVKDGGCTCGLASLIYDLSGIPGFVAAQDCNSEMEYRSAR